MNYKSIAAESMGQTTNHIILEREDGSFTSFPADPNNPVYADWLKTKDQWTLVVDPPVDPVDPVPTVEERLAVVENAIQEILTVEGVAP